MRKRDDGGGGPPDLRARGGLRFVKSAASTIAMIASVVVVVTALGAVSWALVARGAAVAFRSFPDFFTREIPLIVRRPGPGMGPAILGTLLATLAATAMAVPLGLLGAIHLHEYGGERHFARVVRFLATVMTGVPSIVMGLFVYLTFTLRFGYSAFGGALALACLMLPLVVAASESMLRLVPDELREAALALGATKSRTVVTVVLPAAAPGLVSGALLAVARATGETAPLLFTVGAATSFNPRLFHQANTALPLQIFSNATSAFPAAQERAWGAALTLVALAFLATWTARIVTARFAHARR